MEIWSLAADSVLTTSADTWRLFIAAVCADEFEPGPDSDPDSDPDPRDLAAV